MSRYSICIVDNESNMRYPLGNVEQQSIGTTTTFAAQFEFSEQTFALFVNEISYKFIKLPDPKETWNYEVKYSSNKTKKSKKSTRKNR